MHVELQLPVQLWIATFYLLVTLILCGQHTFYNRQYLLHQLTLSAADEARLHLIAHWSKTAARQCRRMHLSADNQQRTGRRPARPLPAEHRQREQLRDDDRRPLGRGPNPPTIARTVPGKNI